MHVVAAEFVRDYKVKLSTSHHCMRTWESFLLRLTIINCVFVYVCSTMKCTLCDL